MTTLWNGKDLGTPAAIASAEFVAVGTNSPNSGVYK
jgi:hypothetical protein